MNFPRVLLLICLLTAVPACKGPTVSPLDSLELFLVAADDRFHLVEEVAKTKFLSGKPIEDPEREKQILAQVEDSAASYGLAPAEARGVIAAQIEAAKKYQVVLHTRWRKDKAEVAAEKSLDELRIGIDSCNDRLLKSYVRVRPYLKDPRVQSDLSRRMDFRASLSTAIPPEVREIALSPLTDFR